MYPQSKYFGFRLHAIADDHLQNNFRKHGTADFALSEWIYNNVKPNWLVYDIGANIFEFTEIAARAAGKYGMVISFEPQKELVNNYLDVMQYNNYNNVADIQIHKYALGKENGQVELRVEQGNIGCASINQHFLDHYHKSDYTVQTIDVKRADNIDLPQRVPDLIKIDIEGAEQDFWEGAPEFLKQAQHIIIEVGPYTDKEFLDEISKDRIVTNINDRPIEEQTNLLLTKA